MAEMRNSVLPILLAAVLAAPAQAQEGLEKWLSAPHRSERNVARDLHRHPAETLALFGVREDSVVVEILPGSADFVLTFRNLHIWIERGEAEGALRAFHQALRPGGMLGVVDHRGRTDLAQEAQMKSGYVREDYAIALVERAGFRLAGRSEVNANPKDTKDYPVGVWALPPTYRMKDQDRAKFAAIGESDRFTLKFEKR
jgi:predicted methyltransferase